MAGDKIRFLIADQLRKHPPNWINPLTGQLVTATECRKWYEIFDPKDTLRHLVQVFKGQQTNTYASECLQKITIHFSTTNVDAIGKTVGEIYEHLIDKPPPGYETTHIQNYLVEGLFSKLKAAVHENHYDPLKQMMIAKGDILDVPTFVERFSDSVEGIVADHANVRVWDTNDPTEQHSSTAYDTTFPKLVPPTTNSTKTNTGTQPTGSYYGPGAAVQASKGTSNEQPQGAQPKSGSEPQSKAKPKHTVEEIIAMPVSKLCQGCGYPSSKQHTYEACHQRSNPHFNTDPSVAWRDSKVGKMAIAAAKPAIIITLERRATPWGPDKPKSTHHAGMCCSIVTDTLILTSLIDTVPDDLIPLYINNKAERKGEQKDSGIEVHALLDTGSLGINGNYVNKDIAHSLCPGLNCFDHSSNIVCSGFDGTCSSDNYSAYLSVKLKENVVIKLKFFVLQSSPFDLIIGKHAIRTHNLIQQFPEYFGVKTNSTSHVHTDTPNVTHVQTDTHTVIDVHNDTPNVTYVHTDAPTVTLVHTDTPSVTNVHTDTTAVTSVRTDTLTVTSTSNPTRTDNPGGGTVSNTPITGHARNTIHNTSDSVLPTHSLSPTSSGPVAIPTASAAADAVTYPDSETQTLPVTTDSYISQSTATQSLALVPPYTTDTQYSSAGHQPGCIDVTDGTSIADDLHLVQQALFERSHDPVETAQQINFLSAGLLRRKDELLTTACDEDVYDEIDPNLMDSYEPFIDTPYMDDEFLNLLSYGDNANLNKKIKAICTEFRSIFNGKLSEEPAKLTPFEIEIDNSKWEVPHNRMPPRVQSSVKSAQICKFTDDLLAAGIIRPSKAEYYSQVVLAVKPHTDKKEWRFCVDYRNLNSCTVSHSWPLPNTKHMFERIGTKKARWFGVIDLTQGFHQIALHPKTTKLTAFITYNGIFEYTRIPFGPKNGPSYFQQNIARVVLKDLLYQICELYIDDIIIFGETEDEFAANCRTIFTRFKEYNILVKPTKAKLGITAVG